MRNVRSQIISSLSVKMTGMGIAFFASIYIARLIGADGVGILALGTLVLGFFIILANFGLDMPSLKVVSHKAEVNDYDGITCFIRWVIKKKLIISLCLTIVLVFLAEFIADNIFAKTELTYIIYILAFAITPASFLASFTHILQGMGESARSQVLNEFIQASFRLLALGILVWLGHVVLVGYVAILNVLAFYVAIIFAFIFFRGVYGKIISTCIDFKKISFSESSPLMWSSLIIFMLTQLDVALLGMYWDASDVGGYYVALTLSALMIVPLGIINSVISPQISQYHLSGRIEELKSLVKKASFVSLFVTIPIFLLFVFLSDNILSMWGDDFIPFSMVLVILATGQLINAMTGPVGNVLILTGKEKIFRNITLGVGGYFIVLGFYLIPEHGAIGAAFVSASSSILNNLLFLLFVRKYYGFWSFSAHWSSRD